MGRILESLLMIILSVFLVMFSTCYLYFKYMYTFWSRKNVPSLEGKFPFGNVQNMFKRKACFGVCFQDLYKQVKVKSKYAGGVFFISKPLLLVVDPDLVKKILIKEFTSFQNRDVAPTDNDPVSANLVVVGGAQWRHLRTKLTPTFTSGKMKMMFDTIKDCTKDLYGLVKCHVDEKRSIDIKDMFARFTTDVIGSCAFGIECNSIKEPNNEFRKHGKMIFDFGYREAIAWTLSLYPWLLKLINIPITNPKVSKFFIDTLRSVVDYREKNQVHRKDFLDLLIRLKNNQSVLDDDSKNTNENFEYGFTFNDMVAQTFIFFAAGFETTSSTLNFCLFELASNIEIQKKLREEVENKMLEYNNILTYDAIMSMTYMDKILQETLRKYPTVPVLSRNCTKDFHVNEINHTVRKGDGIVISTLGIHRDPIHYPEPDQFDPERFTEEEKSKRHPYIYLPFGEGPRMCIGMRFALLQMKLVLSELISNFEFTLDPNTVTPIIFKPDVAFLEPVNTIWIQAQIIAKEKIF